MSIARSSVQEVSKRIFPHHWQLISRRIISSATCRTNAGGIAGFVLPTDNNSFTTPANDRLSLAAGITDVEADGNGILYDGRTVSAAGTLVEVFTTTGAKVAEGYSIDMTGFANGVYVVRAGSKSLKITF